MCYKSIKRKDTYDMRFSYLLLFVIIILCWGFTNLIKTNALNNSKIQEGIANEIIRFHVIANSDSPEDQELKLKVKKALIKKLSPDLSKANNKASSRIIIKNNLFEIKELSEDIIRKNGYNYTVNVTLEKCHFPMKVYGNYTFPAGSYEALRIQIGNAKGKNWWCVMFPPLCFVDETYSIVDEETDEKIKHLLTQEEYQSICFRKTPVKVKFKLWESIRKLFIF